MLSFGNIYNCDVIIKNVLNALEKAPFSETMNLVKWLLYLRTILLLSNYLPTLSLQIEVYIYQEID